MLVCRFSLSIDETAGCRISQLAVATFFSARPGASIDYCVFGTLSIEKIFIATDASFQDAFKKCLVVDFLIVSTI